MTIQIDSREKPKAIKKICETFDKQGITYFRSKLPCGDYMSMSNARFCIDRKQNLSEICKNVCQDHNRFIEELKRAATIGVELVFLIEHSNYQTSCLPDTAPYAHSESDYTRTSHIRNAYPTILFGLVSVLIQSDMSYILFSRLQIYYFYTKYASFCKRFFYIW